MKNFDITVTEADIINGGKGKPSSCPIALAANRALKENGLKGEVRVYKDNLLFILADGTRAWRNTSSDQHRFVKKFDKGRKVNPFTFAFQWAEGTGDVKEITSREPNLSR